ncbi:MAG: deoxyribose-phosphate aldolase [Bradymonadales bacterium]|nr:deoxyribose-phosphate aldolase [Bradymonadales bacterium]
MDAGASRLSSTLGAQIPSGVAGYIDHTLLKPNATESDLTKLCDEAREHQFVSVCVNPFWVEFCARRLAGTPVKVCAVIGFPLGATPPKVKAYEAEQCLLKGASELDMVLNIGALKSRQYDLVRTDIEMVAQACRQVNALSKVILETGLLTDEEKVRACELAKAAGADFVKTSTGFGPGGATVDDVALMRRVVGPAMGVKASGGVKNLEDVQKMISAGANRIGASAGVQIVKGASGAPGEY